MIILRKTKIRESEDQKIQRMVSDLFKYLSTCDLPPGSGISEVDEIARQHHAKNYYNGLSEFLQAIVDYTRGYARSMEYFEKKYKADYASRVYDAIVRKLDGIMKVLP
jgi:Zn-dependent M32 family carboxypeptidase